MRAEALTQRAINSQKKNLNHLGCIPRHVGQCRTTSPRRRTKSRCKVGFWTFTRYLFRNLIRLALGANLSGDANLLTLACIPTSLSTSASRFFLSLTSAWYGCSMVDSTAWVFSGTPCTKTPWNLSYMQRRRMKNGHRVCGLWLFNSWWSRVKLCSCCRIQRSKLWPLLIQRKSMGFFKDLYP